MGDLPIVVAAVKMEVMTIAENMVAKVVAVELSFAGVKIVEVMQ